MSSDAILMLWPGLGLDNYDMASWNLPQQEYDLHEVGTRVAWDLWDPLQHYWAMERIRGWGGTNDDL